MCGSWLGSKRGGCLQRGEARSVALLEQRTFADEERATCSLSRAEVERGFARRRHLGLHVCRVLQKEPNQGRREQLGSQVQGRWSATRRHTIRVGVGEEEQLGSRELAVQRCKVQRGVPMGIWEVGHVRISE